MIGDLWYLEVKGRDPITNFYLQITEPTEDHNAVMYVRAIHAKDILQVKLVKLMPLHQYSDKYFINKINVTSLSNLDFETIHDMLASKDPESKLLISDIIHNLFKQQLNEFIKRKYNKV